MKTIGLIGGMSWESTLEYYRLINLEVKKRLGGLHSAKIVMYSVDFHEIEILQREGRWSQAGAMLAEAAVRIEKAGADLLLICTNTMHKVARLVQESVSLPLIHIADATGEEIVKQKIKKVVLLGTRFTMEQDFMKGRLSSKYGLEVLIPDENGRNLVHGIIYDELCLGTIDEESRKRILGIIEKMKEDGAEGIILGCTELPLLIKGEDASLPLFDTTLLHALQAVDAALD